ncbi:MAG TPA: hypothetical protein VFT87_05420 [Candidatus Saccharimonadales bacterium]|nr:hypothetical protein [Candidatus Saccharimonadales bacterium]
MTEWKVQALIVTPGALEGRNLRTLMLATDGGNDRFLHPSIEEVFPKCNIAAAGPWKWGIDLYEYVPLTELFELEARLLAAMKLAPSFACKGQIVHYTHLPVVQVRETTTAGVSLTCDQKAESKVRQLSEFELSILGVTFDSHSGPTVLLKPGQGIRRLRAVVNFLTFRFDPSHQLTRDVVGKPLP